MKKVGFAVAVADAIPEVKEAATTSQCTRRQRPIREICEFVLRSMGKWEEWVEKVTKMVTNRG